MRFRSLVVVAALALGIPGSATPAEACLNAVVVRVDRVVPVVVRAERAIRQGRPQAAAPLLARADSLLQQSERGFEGTDDDRSAIRQRIRRARATVVIRLQGGYAISRDALNPSADAEYRAVALRWAASTIAAMRVPGHDDPALDALHAEALSQLADGKTEALEILRRLERADLMPDAWAYRALALLEHEQGNTEARDAAKTECARRAGRSARATVCPRFEG